MMTLVMSMTGYGIETFHIDDVTLTVEVRTVNSRYLDFKAHIPRSLNDLELEIKKIVQTYIERGRVELYISTSGSTLEERSLHVDWHLMDQYFEQIAVIKDRYKLTGDIPLSVITTMEELLSIKEEKRSNDLLHNFVLTSVETVMKQVIKTRKTEGAFLMEDIERRLLQISQMVEKIDGRKQVVYEAYHRRIKERIEAHFTEEITYDESQLIQEVALLAEKSDITEEITRLYSHLDHFKQVINDRAAIGRKLDFIIQEIHREANTVGAKSVDPVISEWIVQIKSDLEKMKEQVQNIQ